MDIGGRHTPVDLLQLCHVVQDPERAAVSGHHQVVVRDHHVVDGHDRQVELEGLPVHPIVEGYQHAGLCAGVEQALAFRILAHHSHKGVFRDAVGDLSPGRPVIVGLVDVGLEVVRFVAGHGDKGPARLEGRNIDHGNQAPPGHLLGGDVLPGLAPVTREVDQPIVASHPEGVGIVHRLCQRKDCAVVFHAGVVVGDGAA